MKRFAMLLWVAAAIGCGDDTQTPQDDGGVNDDGSMDDGGPMNDGGSMNGALLVDVSWAAARLEDNTVQFVDARPLDDFESGHIAGALHLEPLMVTQTRDGVFGQVIDRSGAESAFRTAGLENDTTVIVYGAPPEYDPARIAWVLTYYGHNDVRWMDGGYAAWVSDGQPTAMGTSTAAPSDYAIAAVDEDLRVTGDWVLSALGDAPYGDATIKLVDARSPGEFSSGRIPTALHVQWTRNLDGGFMKAFAEVQALYPNLSTDDTVVTYCLTGWRGSVSWFTLRWLGFTDVRLYDGSWAEWGNDARFPVETD